MPKTKNIRWDKAQLNDLYYNQQKCLTEIGEIFGVDHAAIYYQMKKLGIKSRSRSEAHKLLFKQGKHKPPEALRGQLSPHWKGGRYKGKLGYIDVRLQPNDYFYSMVGSNGYVREHRLVMAKYLNRCLLPWEIVHHKNGIKDDNRLENLELFPTTYKHNIISKFGYDLKKLQDRVDILEKENRLLRWQIKEIRELRRPL